MTRMLVLAATAAVGLLPAQERPLSIVLLIDVTGSVSDAMATLATNRQPDGTLAGVKAPNAPRDLFLNAVESAFLGGLAPGERARIGRVARTVDLGPDFTTDPTTLRQAATAALDVPDELRYGPSPLWDAVDAAVGALRNEPGRRVVVLVTDGLSTGNRLSLQAVIDRAKSANVSVSVVGEWFGAPRPLRRSFRGAVGSGDHTASTWRDMRWPFGNAPFANLERLARSTGGVFVPDGVPLCYAAWASGESCGMTPQRASADCGAFRRSARGLVGGSSSPAAGSNRSHQCAGEDPQPGTALARVLAELRRS